METLQNTAPKRVNAKSVRSNYLIPALLSCCFFFVQKTHAQDNTGPVLSAFTQSSTVDITSGGVTITFLITVTDSSTLSSVSSAPFLYSNAGSPTITSGYNTFSNWAATASTTALWKPSDWGSLRAWIDFSNAANYTLSGSKITQVIDRSGTFGTISIASDNQPTITTDSSLGQKVASFDGVKNYIDGGAYKDVVAGGSHISIGIFKAITVTHRRQSLWSYEAPSGSGKRDYAISAGNDSDFLGEIDLDALSSNRISNKDKIDFNSASTVLGSGSSYRGSWRIFNASFDWQGSKRIFARVDGRQAAYESVYSNEINNGQLWLRLMRNRGNQWLKGQLAEFITFEKNPGITGTDNYNVEVIEGYLAHKWNLEGNLPTSHPFKTQAPTTNVSYTFSAKLYLDPNEVPNGTYKINLSHGAFVDSSSSANVASLPAGYGDFNIEVVNDATSPTVLLDASNDGEDLIATDTVTLTAVFSEPMSSSPTLSISGLVTDSSFDSFIDFGNHIQLGSDVEGSLSGGKAANKLAMSKNGEVIAFRDNASGSDAVKVVEFVSGEWQMKGTGMIEAETPSDGFGQSIALSADGSLVAIGASLSKYVKVFQYHSATNTWTLYGTKITEGATATNFGVRLDLSDDGNVLAVSANRENAGDDDEGVVRVYEYNATDDEWNQIGSDLEGDAEDLFLGQSMALSGNGKVLAIGSGVYGPGASLNTGIIRVYQYGSDWTKIGEFTGVNNQDQLGYKEGVDLSRDGYTIAYGIPGFDSSGTDRGKVVVQIYNGSSWSQKGSDLLGAFDNDNFGTGVRLSKEGNYLAVGATGYDDGSQSNLGQIKLYGYDSGSNSWGQKSNAINGAAANDQDGEIFALSESGFVIAAASYGHNSNTGHFRVFANSFYRYNFDVDGTGTPSDGAYYATVSGSDSVGNVYTETDSITLNLDTSTPTVVLTSSDSDFRVTKADTVTITAVFSKQMSLSPTPTLSISGLVTNVTMVAVGQTTYTYTWIVSETPIVDNTAYSITVSGTSRKNQPYTGTTSLVFKIPYTSSEPSITTESVLGRDINLDGDQLDAVYQISNLKELLWLSEKSNSELYSWSKGKVFLQTADIDATPTQYWDDDDTDDFSSDGDNQGWLPLALNNNNGWFLGFYNGDRHRITGLHLNRTTSGSSDSEIGFISEMYQSGATAVGIVNLGFIDANYTVKSTYSQTNIGGIVAKGTNSSDANLYKLSDLFFEGTIDFSSSTTNPSYVGGLLGQFVISLDNKISRSYFNGTIKGNTSTYGIGGIAGRFNGMTLENVYARGKIIGNNTDNASLVGYLVNSVSSNQKHLTNAYATIAFEKIDGTSLDYGMIGDYSAYSGKPTPIVNNLYWNSFISSPTYFYNSKDSGVDVSSVNSEALNTTVLASAEALTKSGLDSSTIWGQNATLNDGYPYLIGWMDFGLTKSGVDSAAASGDSIGELIFNDAGTGATITYHLNSEDYDNQYFSIDTGSGTPTVKLNASGVAQLSSIGTFTLFVSGTTNESPATVLKRKFKLPVRDMSLPTVTLTASDPDLIVSNNDTVTFTATFSKGMADYPTITIGNGVNKVRMTATSSSVWTYILDMTTWTGSKTASITVAGEDSLGNRYAGTDSLTLVLDTTSPTVTLTSTDSDNYINSTDTVTVTAAFSEAMAATPTISISGMVTDVVMTLIAGTNSYTYYWDVDAVVTPTFGDYTVTVSGTDLAGYQYSESTSITFTLGSF
ncbi:MAG: hypothetical protein ACON47_10760, partial [Flavobacteriaceae bacterium]